MAWLTTMTLSEKNARPRRIPYLAYSSRGHHFFDRKETKIPKGIIPNFMRRSRKILCEESIVISLGK
jgi:hypothetical protein